MADRLNGVPLNGGKYSRHDTSRRVGLLAVGLSLVLLGRSSALAGTVWLTELHSLAGSRSFGCADVSFDFENRSRDLDFQLRDGRDPVFSEFELKGQASADHYPGCNLPYYGDSSAFIGGDVKFRFQLPDMVALWDIHVTYGQWGVVANDGRQAAAFVGPLRPYGAGVAASLESTLVLGASQNTTGATAFRGMQEEMITNVFGPGEWGAVVFPIDLRAYSDGGEAYASLGSKSGLSDGIIDTFGLDDDHWYPAHGMGAKLTLTPHLNLSGQSFPSDLDLTLASGETLSGYGEVAGKVSGVAGSAIFSASNTLTLGDPNDPDGFTTAGDVTVVGGTLMLRDADVAVLESGGSLTMFGGTVVGTVCAQEGSEVNLFGTQFVVDGTDITNTLNPNAPFIIDDRGVIFSGLLADGSPFSFDLGCFSASATLTATLVPEPSSFVLLVALFSASVLFGRRVARPC